MVAQTLGTQFLGAQYSEAGTFPDSMGAAGPTQYIVMVNGLIRSFNKSTGVADGVLNAGTNSFFGSVRGSANAQGPHVRYDRLTGRWFFIMMTSAYPNRVLMAFADNGVITLATSFYFTYYDVNVLHPNCLWDHDTLGIDQNALYIGGNLFCPSYDSSDGLVVSKASLLAGSPGGTDFVLASVGSAGVVNGPTSPQGVDNYDSTSSLGYFAGETLLSSHPWPDLAFARISNAGSRASAVLVTLTAPAMYPPAPSPALGSTNPLDAGSWNLTPTQLRNGHLWTAQVLCVDATGAVTPGSCPAGSRDGVRWYDITNLASTPVINQSGTTFDPTASNPRFYFDPSIMVSGQGHVAMGTSVAGNTEHAEAATLGRLAGDPLGSMGPAVVYQPSAFTYNLQSTSPQVWGVYSYTSLDPSDDMTMWTIQEFTNATNSWGVEAVQLKAPPPATPLAASSAWSGNPCSQVTVTGTSTNGSGFFDPGPGFANRLQASVSGGVTVNHVGYVDPTHITLDISTVGATPGLKDLTVTNPDGQTVTISSLINIQAAASQPAIQGATSTTQYKLQNSDGVTWQEIDAFRLRITCTAAADNYTLLSANADLFTGDAGYNQDIGIFVSDNGGADTLLAWKESGGFAGIFSPNAAFVQTVFQELSGHTYVFKLKWKTNNPASGATIFAGAGSINTGISPTSLIAKNFPVGAQPNFAVRTQQYKLPNPSGSTWADVDAVTPAHLTTTLTAASDSTAVLGANVDLFTGDSGVNQDIGIMVKDGVGPDQLVGWKESGGFAGIFSPNAAFLKATWPMVSGHSYAFRLVWKANNNAPGKNIFAGAGPQNGPISPTSLTAETIAIGANPYEKNSTQQYHLQNSDGATWQNIDATNLFATISPISNTNSIVSANVDLFTGDAGYNQDIGIFVSDNGGPDTMLAWKESGGFAGIFSPNAAFAQATYPITASHTYVFKLKWKTNKNAPGATIFAAAGASPYSPTRLTVELTS